MAVHYSDIRLLLTVELKHVTIIYVGYGITVGKQYVFLVRIFQKPHNRGKRLNLSVRTDGLGSKGGQQIEALSFSRKVPSLAGTLSLIHI